MYSLSVAHWLLRVWCPPPEKFSGFTTMLGLREEGNWLLGYSRLLSDSRASTFDGSNERLHAYAATIIMCCACLSYSYRSYFLLRSHGQTDLVISKCVRYFSAGHGFIPKQTPTQAKTPTAMTIYTRAVLSPCKFRYVKSLRNFMWKPCYRKDGRAMRPIRGCPENFRHSWLRPRLLFPKFFMDFCSARLYNVPTKFEVRSFTRSWDPKNLGSPWIRPRSLFS